MLEGGLSASKTGKVELLWGEGQFWGGSGASLGTVMRRYHLNEDLKESANCISGMFQKEGVCLESSGNIREAKCG